MPARRHPLVQASFLGRRVESVRVEYNSKGKRTKETDPLGRQTTYCYDANGIDLLQVRQTTGRPSTDPDACTGGPGSAGINDLLTSSTYNAQHQPLTITDAYGATTTLTYTPQGQVATITSPPADDHPAGATTTLSYAGGYLTSIDGPVAGATTTFTYDAAGRRRTATGPDLLTLTYDYDDMDRPTRLTWPNGTFQETVYDRLHIARRRDRLGRWTHTFYDALRRAVGVRDPAGRTVTYKWCNCGRLESLEDARGNQTRWEYDEQGRMVKEIRADSTESLFAYETTTSRLKERTDRRGIKTTYEYYLDDRLERKSYTDIAPPVEPTPPVEYTYDSAYGRLETATIASVPAAETLTWSYDLNGQLLTEASAANGSTVAYEYDAAGNRVKMMLDGTPFVEYGYDASSRLESITRSTDVFGFTYDTASRRATMTYPNGIVTTYSYDSESRLDGLDAKLGSTFVTGFGYEYDEVGNRTQKATLDYVEDYAYDRAQQLVGVQRTGATLNRWYFGYDRAGNRTSQQVDTLVTQASYDEMNQLDFSQPGGGVLFRGSIDEPAAVTVQGQPAQVEADNTFVGPAEVISGTSQVQVEATDPAGNVRTNTYELAGVTGGSATYQYDPNGNLTQKVESGETWDYVWNAENQLIRVCKDLVAPQTCDSDGVAVASFKYDPKGRRIERTAGGVAEAFVYDHESAVVRSVAGGTFKYVYGPRIDEPLVREASSGARTYYHADALSSVVATTDQAGVLTQSIRYDVWGQVESGAPEEFGFTGRELDAATGLSYYRARYYDPSAGRFISEDPLRWRVSLNFYPYVNNDPAGSIDPLGLQAVRCIDCEGKEPQVEEAARKFCRNLKTKRCRAALEQLGPPGGMLKCAERQCSGVTSVICQPKCSPMSEQQGGPCVPGLSDPREHIYLTENPFSVQSQVDKTYAHEMAHMCGVGPDAQKNPAHEKNRRMAATVEQLCTDP